MDVWAITYENNTGNTNDMLTSVQLLNKIGVFHLPLLSND